MIINLNVIITRIFVNRYLFLNSIFKFKIKKYIFHTGNIVLICWISKQLWEHVQCTIFNVQWRLYVYVIHEPVHFKAIA